jgi:hypothetical protein
MGFLAALIHEGGFPALLLGLFEFGRATPFGFSPRNDL